MNLLLWPFGYKDMQSKIYSIVIISSIFVFAPIAVVEMPNIFENVLAQQTEDSQQGSSEDRRQSSNEELDRRQGISQDFERTEGSQESSSETLDRIPDTEHRSSADTTPDSERRSSADTTPDSERRSSAERSSQP